MVLKNSVANACHEPLPWSFRTVSGHLPLCPQQAEAACVMRPQVPPTCAFVHATFLHQSEAVIEIAVGVEQLG
jgi:hypothetical protein